MSDTSAPTLEESFPIPGSEEEPNSLRMLGWKLLDWDPEAQQIKVGFETRKEFRNPGEEDLAPGVEVSKNVAGSAQTGSLHVVPRCGHYVSLEQPEALREILCEVVAAHA